MNRFETPDTATPEDIILAAVEFAIETAKAKDLPQKAVDVLTSLRGQPYRWWKSAAIATGTIKEGPGYPNLAGYVSETSSVRTGHADGYHRGRYQALDLVRRVAGAVYDGSLKLEEVG